MTTVSVQEMHQALEQEYFDFVGDHRVLKPGKDEDEFKELHAILWRDVSDEKLTCFPVVAMKIPTEKSAGFLTRLFGRLTGNGK
jgi:hypothetical protein